MVVRMTDPQRNAINILVGISIAQSVAICVLLVVMLSSCKLYAPLDQTPIEVEPICEIVIDHVHGTSETHGDCDAGEW
jgi:hypothetical protein